MNSNTRGALRLSLALTSLLLSTLAHAAPQWQEGSTYTAGTVVSFNGHDYKALVTHTAYVGAGWTPSGTPTLWQDLGGSGTVSPTPTPTPLVTPTPSLTPTPAFTPTPTVTPTVTPSQPAGNCAAPWNAATAYNGAASVSYNGRNYSAKWWTQGDDPSKSTEWGVWKDLGSCGSTSITPTPPVTPTPTPPICPMPTPIPGFVSAYDPTLQCPNITVPAGASISFDAVTVTGNTISWRLDTSKYTGTPGRWRVIVGKSNWQSDSSAIAIADDFQNSKAYWTGSAAINGTGEFRIQLCNASYSNCVLSQVAGTTVITPTPTATPTPTITPTVTPTVTPTGTPADLPKHVLVGYLHASFANGSGYIRMSDVSDKWDIINLSFAEPTSSTSGQVAFKMCPSTECPNVESEAEFIAAIKAKQALGKKVQISIGGANGQVRLENAAAVTSFVNSVSAIIDKYGLDGLDVDFEGHSLQLNPGDNDLAKPTTPVVVNLISALKQLKAKYGSKFTLTMAPETFFVQLGYSFYGGNCAGCDTRAGAYLPVIYAMRDDLTLLHVQDYNSGPITGLDNSYHTMGNADFHVAMTDMLLTGFKVAGTNFQFPALRQDQIAIGLPANGNAGGGFTSVADVQTALDCLMKGTSCGNYKPRGVYPNLRGLMTWSVNWDKFNNFEFSTQHRAYFDKLAK